MALLDFFNKRNKDTNAEMSFIDHLEDLRWHVLRSVVAILIAAIVVFIYSDFVVDRILFAPTHANFVSSRWLCILGHKVGIGNTLCFPEVKATFLENTMTGQFIASFTLAFIGGFIIAFPYIFWEFWRFVKPALSPKELKKTKRCYLLGIHPVFYGSGFWLLYPHPFHGQFLF
jgi:sec-independent protein translocase protein TatC